jgi:hypothetical protein
MSDIGINTTNEQAEEIYFKWPQYSCENKSKTLRTVIVNATPILAIEIREHFRIISVEGDTLTWNLKDPMAVGDYLVAQFKGNFNMECSVVNAFEFSLLYSPRVNLTNKVKEKVSDPFLYHCTYFVRAVKIKTVKPRNIFSRVKETFSKGDARVYFELEQDDEFHWTRSDFDDCNIEPMAGDYLVNFIDEEGSITHATCLKAGVFEKRYTLTNKKE